MSARRPRPDSASEFDARLRAGVPFIVADAGGGSEWLSRPCEYYSERWPEGRMRMEYTRGEGVKYVPLAHDAWRSRDRWRSAHGEHMAEGGKASAEIRS